MNGPVQLWHLLLAFAIPVVGVIVAAVKVKEKTEDHERRIETLDSDVKAMRDHVVETRNDVKWIKEAIQRKG